ncbi:MAG: prenyltransferase [Candidatus Aenigmarchaeota archaeon]
MSVLDWIRLSRFRLNYLIAIMCGIALSQQFSLSTFILVLTFSYSALFYGVFVNFVHDYGSDKMNPSMKMYAHVSGKIPLDKIKNLSRVFLAVTIMTGIVLGLIRNNFLFIILLVWAIHCGFSYSSPPLRLKRFWWGGIVTYTFSTAVIFLTSALAFGANDLLLITLSVFVFWFGSLSVWALTHISDKKFDRKNQVVTPAMKFGLSKALVLHNSFLFISSIFAILVSVLFLKMWWIFSPFIATMILSYLWGKSIIGERDLGVLRKRAHTFGVAPYWLNISFLTMVYALGIVV